MINQGFHLRRNVIVSVLAFAVNLVLTFLVYRLVISVGGLGSLGLWSTLMSWIFLVRLGDLGMGTAVVRFVSGCEASHETGLIRAYIDTSLLLNLGLFVVLAVIGYFLFLANLDWIIPNDPAHPEARGLAADVLPVMFTAFVLSNISGLVLGGLTGLHKGYKSAIVTTFGMMVQLCIVVPLVPRIGLAGLAWGQFGQHAVMILVGWALVLRDLKAAAGGHGGIWPRHFSRPALQEMLGYSLKTQLSNIINGLFEPVSKILVGQIGGLTGWGCLTPFAAQGPCRTGSKCAAPPIKSLSACPRPRPCRGCRGTGGSCAQFWRKSYLIACARPRQMCALASHLPQSENRQTV